MIAAQYVLEKGPDSILKTAVGRFLERKEGFRFWIDTGSLTKRRFREIHKVAGSIRFPSRCETSDLRRGYHTAFRQLRSQNFRTH